MTLQRTFLFTMLLVTATCCSAFIMAPQLMFRKSSVFQKMHKKDHSILYQVISPLVTAEHTEIKTKTTTTILETSNDEMMIDLHDGNYQQILGGSIPVLIDAYAPWCGPCKLIEAVLERCAERYSSTSSSSSSSRSLIVARYNVERKDCINLKLELALQGVIPKALPTLILFHKNHALNKIEGLVTDDILDDYLHQTFSNVWNEKEGSATTASAAAVSKRETGKVHFGGMNSSDDYMLTRV